MLKVGDPAPEFEVKDHRGRTVNGAEYSVLKLTSSSSSKCPHIIPPLYESALLIVDSEHFKLRGFERLGIGDDAFTVLRFSARSASTTTPGSRRSAGTSPGFLLGTSHFAPRATGMPS